VELRSGSGGSKTQQGGQATDVGDFVEAMEVIPPRLVPVVEPGLVRDAQVMGGQPIVA